MGSIEEAEMGYHILILLLVPLSQAELSGMSSDSKSMLSKTETIKPDIDLDIEGQSVNDPGMDATSKACRYDDGPGWSDCDPFELSRYRVLRLIHGGSQCEEVKNITKHCTPHDFPYGTHWLIQEHRKCISELNRLKYTLDELTQKLDKLKVEGEHQQEVLKKIKDEIEDWKSKARELQVQLDELKSKFHDLEAEEHELNLQNEQLTTDINIITKENESIQKKIEKISRENDEL